MDSATDSKIVILARYFYLPEALESDVEYILEVAQRELDQHAYKTTKRISYTEAQTGLRKARYEMKVTFTTYFTNEQVQKTLFKLRLKYPRIKLFAG